MGQLIEGVWHSEVPIAHTQKGEFIRPKSVFDHWVRSDLSHRFPAERGRYHLYVSHACPWAHRAVVMRHLKGLQDVISISSVASLMGDKGWSFTKDGGEYADPLFDHQHLHQLYTQADPAYTGKVTVPVLWDKQTQQIVNNESSDIMRMLNSEFNAFTDHDFDYYPAALQDKIDQINDFVYERINNGVYRCGFATTQEAYDEAFGQLFAALDEIDHTLSQQAYLIGEQITEADWRMFTTLIRFDSVYYGHFKCNQRLIKDYPNLSGYLKRLYQVPQIAETVNFDYIKAHYYASHGHINPTGIIPQGPCMDWLLG